MDPKIFNIIKEHKDRPNRDLETAMNYLNEEFEKTKNLIIGLTHHLDKTEEVYNLFLKEHKKRNG
jgi:hypothetical protein